MKRVRIVRLIGNAARRAEVEFAVEREGANHKIYRLGSVRFAVPRHREINEYTAEGILKQCEAVLGERWWR